MIKIENPTKPDYLESTVVEDAKIALQNQVAAGAQKLTIPSHWGDINSDNKIKNVLFDAHHGKCCYCERERTRKREMDVEHCRPKARVTEDPSHRGYWWLAYDWDNYLWSCKSCNQEYKGNHFPLPQTGVRAEKEGDNLVIENPYLINPRFDEPSEFLVYYKKKYGGRWFVRMSASPDLNEEKRLRAEETIRILGLNRNAEGDDLISERGRALSAEFEQIALGLCSAKIALSLTAELDIIDTYKDIIDRYRNRLKDYVSSNKEFSGFFRYFLADLGIDYSDLI